MGKQKPDWTVDPETGRSNSSPAYLAAVDRVKTIILGSGYDIVRGQIEGVARLIVSNLAHGQGLQPKKARR